MPPVSILPGTTDNRDMVSTYNKVGKREKSTNTKDAKNLPKMMSFSFRGNVDNISMVPDLYSSANERMVNAGNKNKSTQGAKAKNLSIVA